MTRGVEWPRDCQKRSQSGLCSKLPDMRSVGDIALNPSLRKIKRELSLKMFTVSSYF